MISYKLLGYYTHVVSCQSSSFMEVVIVSGSNKIYYIPCIAGYICVYNDNIMRIWVEKCTNHFDYNDLLFIRRNKRKINRKNVLPSDA